jgi:hypothetical protein
VIAGLPGTGIGGLFYLVSALLMPFRELWRAIVGRTEGKQRRAAMFQGALAVGIVFAVWVTGVALSIVHIGDAVTRTHTGHAALPTLHVFYIAPVIVAFATLVAVLLTVELLYLVLTASQHVSRLLGSERIATPPNESGVDC